MDERSPPSPSRPRRHPAVMPRPAAIERPRSHRAATQPSSVPAAIKRPRRHQAASPPSRGSSLLRKPVRPSPCWADGLNIPMTPSRCRLRLRAAFDAVFMRPSPPSCGPRRLHAAVASFVRPSPSLCGHRRLHAALATFVRHSPFSCGHYRTCPASAAAGERPAIRWLILFSSSS